MVPIGAPRHPSPFRYDVAILLVSRGRPRLFESPSYDRIVGIRMGTGHNFFNSVWVAFGYGVLNFSFPSGEGTLIGYTNKNSSNLFLKLFRNSISIPQKW